MTPAGFPHSDIPGSKTVCVSPRLIAAYHVLHRLLVPRHPPCALSSLTGYQYQGASTEFAQRLVFDCQRSSAARLRRGRTIRKTEVREDLSSSARGGTLSHVWWR